jgi:predicted aspartyl protease
LRSCSSIEFKSSRRPLSRAAGIGAGLLAAAVASGLLWTPRPVASSDAKEMVKEAIAAHGGAEYLVKSETAGVRRGTFNQYIPAPNSGTFVEWKKGDKTLIEVRLAGLEVVQGYDGQRAWVKSLGQVIDAPDQIQTAIEEESRHGMTLLVDALDKGYLIEQIEPSESREGAPIEGVRITPAEGAPPTSFYFDPDTHLVTKISFTDVNPYQGGQADFEAYLFDYRDFGGGEYASKVAHFIDGVQMDEVTYESVDFDAVAVDEMFVKPGAEDLQTGGSGEREEMGDFKVEVPIEYSLKMLFVKVAVGDAATPFSFILDTGAGMTCLSKDLADELGVESTGDMNAAGAGGALDAHTARLDRLAIGALEVSDLDVMVLDIAPISNMMGRRIDGILGYNVLNRYTTTIDISGETLTFESSDAALPSGEGYYSVPFEVLMGVPVVEGVLNGSKKLDFLVDTGASMSVLPMAVAEELGPKRRLEGAMAAGADTRPIDMGLGRFDELALGAATIDEPVFSYPLTAQKPDPLGVSIDTANRGVIGTGILGRFRVTLNYDKATIVLHPVEPPPGAANEWSGPGLTVFMDSGSPVVRSVFKNGPADGLIEAGDRILKIGGAEVEGVGLEEIVEMLQGDPGSELELTIERGGAVKNVTLKRMKLL